MARSRKGLIVQNTRAPRGTGNLKKAFFAAANDIPDDKRAEVVRAALASIRDDLKAEREKAAKTRQKARLAAGKKPMGRPRVARAA